MRPALPMIVTLSAAALVSTAALTTDAFGRPSPRAERKAKELSAWKPAGEPVDCVRTRDIKNTRVLANNVIDFELRGGKRYRNILPYACPSLNWEERFSHRTFGGQLCSIDTITVLQNYGAGLHPGATCMLGEFHPVEKAEPTG